ncbi:MAG: beta-N-acetylhexosaminidase [Thermodesulfobacteriota bacterium]|nr:beta-N-acetylhexosaminidase [Thermodesulfobacteriota bacterium]
MSTTTDIKKFSPDQIAGQHLMVGFEGTKLNQELMFLIDTIKVGGVILFSGNLHNYDQIKNLCSSIQNYALSKNQPPLFISIDQEGGQVARLKKPFTQFPGNPEMKGPDDAEYFAATTAKELREVGINMNMAPVLDVAPENIQSIMAQRAFGADPEFVSDMGAKVIEHLQRRGVMAVAKHFPGIGRTTTDSHVELPFVEADLSDLKSFDLLPFVSAVKNDVAGVMLSHILYRQIDPVWPASMSSIIAKELLRDQMGYDGIVMTDDLDMGAVVKHYDIITAIRQILAAEIDVVLICHQGPDIETGFTEIRKNIIDSQEIKAKSEASLRRILKLKQRYLSL